MLKEILEGKNDGIKVKPFKITQYYIGERYYADWDGQSLVEITQAINGQLEVVRVVKGKISNGEEDTTIFSFQDFADAVEVAH